MERRAVWMVVELTGAVVGGVVGVWLFEWIAQQGFYAIIVPAALVGFGSLALARGNSIVRGLLCGVIALATMIYAEWRVFPFVKDQSLTYFVTHLFDLRPIKLILMAVGVLLAIYLGRGSVYPPRRMERHRLSRVDK